MCPCLVSPLLCSFSDLSQEVVNCEWTIVKAQTQQSCEPQQEWGHTFFEAKEVNGLVHKTFVDIYQMEK